MNSINTLGKSRWRGIVLIVEFMEEQLGLLKICEKDGFIGEVDLQALIGDPRVENCQEMS